ncbi:unnamed protein product [Didymodactylos carnosus]|uniref:Helicase ATP-binding domain-containing protein n=1 Tax=Didymodactylos carnosus TaxID=1234261 RepID=A0A815J1U7_9BILA|nr:unnamed protein product [Didymodactylos carnosus]CAF4261664.1 unnamed protein product [Didymodactylos carnosus]
MASYNNTTWLQDKLNGSDGYYYRKAQNILLFDQTNSTSSALDLFNISGPILNQLLTSMQIQEAQNADFEHQESFLLTDKDYTWTLGAQKAVRELCKQIVTYWLPSYLYSEKPVTVLHSMLINKPLLNIPLQFAECLDFDVNKTLDKYKDIFIPLHYHELWSEFMNSYNEIDHNDGHHIKIKFYNKNYIDKQSNAKILLGQVWTNYINNLNPQSRVLSPYDVILLIINNIQYFGIIVYAQHKHIKSKETSIPRENITVDKWTIVQSKKENQSNQIELETKIYSQIGIYVSDECYEIFHKNHNIGQLMNIIRLTSLTPTKRHITAIMNLSSWPQYKSLLAPSLNDPYYQLADQSNVIIENCSFNQEQKKTIQIAVNMFDDIQERLFLIDGPPGTGKSKTIAGIVGHLLDKLDGNKKILICAPSNTACDELMKKILEYFNQTNQAIAVCTNFNRCTIEKQIEKKILTKAKIIISTLNYSASSRLRLLNNFKTCISFIIVDEACQASEVAAIDLSPDNRSI